MSENNVKKNYNYYIPLCIAMGVVFGTIFNHLAIGISLGLAIGAIAITLNNKKKK